MTRHLGSVTHLRVLLVVVTLVAAAACGGKNPKSVLPANTAQPDQFLMDRGNQELQKKHWAKAREYFKQVVDNYPNSALRPDAKLAVGDTYMSEGGADNEVLAENEFREFLTFYPTNPRADYAQYQLAMTHFKQMRSAERDQTETKDAVKEFQTFFDRFPNSKYMPEVRQKWREARDRLSEASYRVGLYYYRVKWYPGAVSRFREVLMEDPGYTHRDDVYFYLAECYANTPTQKAEAIPYLQRLITEFPKSERLEDARKRMQELQAEQAEQAVKTQVKAQ
ncbi:MAG TPA: outer membrane protein assembly factor BamD [Vicinamibacterales bacterium]|nr:outer membrane protein assembly factor BamD [Vicinamibacterales bacterium]